MDTVHVDWTAWFKADIVHSNTRVANYWSPTRQCDQILSVDYQKSKTGRPLGDQNPHVNEYISIDYLYYLYMCNINNAASLFK